ncbi:protein Abitram-like [Oscarella lobularis]|uniref:protein Abitram-like n=1 Tax=Oscarella lobularis TaxID=121494 RepID=UPI0033139920
MAAELFSEFDASACVPRVPFLDRYFTRAYAVDTKDRLDEDTCVLQHSNKMCVICLAPSHPIVTSPCRKVLKVDYKISESTDRTANVVKGKRKRGAQWLNPLSPLCIITCDDGSQYTVYSCIRGSLLEVNDQLTSCPDLVRTKTLMEGYIAVVAPKKAESDTVLAQLKTESEYVGHCKIRAHRVTKT